MLIQGSSRTQRTEFLINKYAELLNSGIEASEILVLLQNSYKKDCFVDAFKSKLQINHFEDAKIFTFYGLCYNTIQNYWSFAENAIDFGEPQIHPYLIGLEISQFFLKKAVAEVGFNDYNSKINLFHQLFRRNSLIVNNNLSDKDVLARAEILKESFADDAQMALDIFKKYTLEYRAFDYIRQVSLFNHLLEKTNCFKDIKYLILDDADEITPVEFDFIKKLYPQLTDFWIGYDKYGSTRLGFLNTDENTIENIEKTFSMKGITNLDTLQNPIVSIEKTSHTRNLQMVENALDKVNELINNGVSFSEIAIIVPQVTKTLKYVLFEKFKTRNINYQVITGSEKLSQNSVIKNIITLLKFSLGEKIQVFDLKSLLSELCSVPIKYCLKVIQHYIDNEKLQYFDLNNDKYNDNLRKLIEVLEKIKESNLSLSEKLFVIYDSIVLSNKINIPDLDKINFFVKQLKDFENVFAENSLSLKFQNAVLLQLENSIVAENPSNSPIIEDNSIVISTAQKIIDLGYKTKYQIWLDTTSLLWAKDDFGTLYNAWVFQKSWNKDNFTYEDNLRLSSLKLQKTIRKLKLLTSEKIYCFSSTYDENGVENSGSFENYIQDIDISLYKNEINFVFDPRDDQKPVLEYKSGYMGISAVPGAGKTTILLALIIKLLKNKVKSDNIFVLTYMDSAARNFRERIKVAYPTLEKLPNISTIHGLALRILTENANYVNVGLDENFEICDDIQRQKIIREILLKLQIEQDEYDKYQTAVSYLKLSNLSKLPFTKDLELYKFLKFYNFYNTYLLSKNMIDYDDMLVKSVQLLENNKDIAEYYQNICHYVIEDEAQDSSLIQQRLLNILSEKHKNLIRCGDINQAITTTFTNADMEGFRKFILNNNNVTMNYSQRCAKDIYTLANKLINFAKRNDDYKNAFFDIEMKEVVGKNPQSNDAVFSNIFDTQKEERDFILAKIREIFAKDKNASIAILVRNNHNVEDFSRFLSGYGYNIETRNDILCRQPVFNLVHSLLEFCCSPWKNENVVKVANVLSEQQILKLTSKDIEYIQNLRTPFVLENQDNLSSYGLTQLIWDLEYWLQNSTLNIEDLAVKIGMYYYNSEIERSNVYVISQLLKNLDLQYKNKENFFEKLSEIATKNINTKYRLFESENSFNGGIKIMTYHKSKGDEFDYVFIPELTEKNLTLSKDKIKIKSKERFIEAVKSFNHNYKKKNENEQKIFQIEENLRLLYVAFTRAKRKLFVTASFEEKVFSRLAKAIPSILFQELFGKLGGDND